LWDTAGRRYLDAISGIAVCGLGHAHPAVHAALCEQSGKLVHTSNLYGIGLQEELARELLQRAGMSKAFFCNSGAEAVEASIKLARLYGHGRGVNEPTIVVMENSFHGRTLATLTATGNRKVQQGFEPLVPGFLRAPYDDVAALQAIAERAANVVAVLLEPVQGEGGIRVPAGDYLGRVAALCDQHGWLLMLDEVQTGIARTGRWFGFQHSGIQPDVMALAKGLANGVPIGACLAGPKAAEVFQPGSHASTFGGNPLACSAALAVLRTITEADLVQRAAELGERLLHALRQGLGPLRGVVEVRGRGLMIGIELERPCAELVEHALAQGLLINVTAERVLRLLPPLILSDEQCDQLAADLCVLVGDFLDAR
jgi:acetylornithine aminotransferase